MPEIYAILSVVAVSLLSFVGVFALSINQDRLRRHVFVLVSLAVGALLGDAFIHIIPEVFADSAAPTATSLYIIAGIIIFFAIEKFLHWHHHDNDAAHNHAHPVGKLILISDGLHNFLDGLIIAASFAVSIPVGIATTIAVILHEIPQEIGDFGVLIHAGYSRGQALLLNFLSALGAVIGALVFIIFGSDMSGGAILPIAAGGFIYIALSDLVPELQKTKTARSSVIQFVAILIGIAAMAALTLVE